MPDPIHTVWVPPSPLVTDANGDGRVTLGDVPAWLAHLFLWPGDWALWVIAKYAPPLASLLGGDALTYGGFVAGFIAAAFWCLVLVMLGTAYAYVVAFDRRATRASSRAYAEIRRALRAASRRLRARLRGSEQRE